MADTKEQESKRYEDWSMKNWRAWGSWFSWGSPVGLSFFFATVTGCIWVLVHLFK